METKKNMPSGTKKWQGKRKKMKKGWWSVVVDL